MTVTQEEKDNALRGRSYGRYINVDFTNELSEIEWKELIGLEKYASVGAFEGGYYYGRGVWRPEIGSCMINNISYYNAPSRYSIIRRIMALNNIPFTFSDFINVDDPSKAAIGAAIMFSSDVTPMPPLSPPVFVE